MARLSIERQNEIDVKIDDLLNSTGYSYPENNLLEIVRKLGIGVYLLDFEGQNISGAINYGVNGENPQILLNINEGKERKNFSLAHELGHYILHKGALKFRVDYIEYGKAEELIEETEANYFAASLLMPETKLREILGETQSVSAIAKFFGVSEAALRNRVRWINANRA